MTTTNLYFVRCCDKIMESDRTIQMSLKVFDGQHSVTAVL